MVPYKVPLNSCQDFDWEFELIVTFPHAGTTANLPVFHVLKFGVRTIGEVLFCAGNWLQDLVMIFSQSPNEIPHLHLTGDLTDS